MESKDDNRRTPGDRNREMNLNDKRLLLAEHLAEFRSWSYAALVEEIDRTKTQHGCLRHSEGVSDDGTEWQMEFNVFWDDKRGGHVRVCGDISTVPQAGLLRILPVYFPDATDSFIMAPDGSFIGEVAVSQALPYDVASRSWPSRDRDFPMD